MLLHLQHNYNLKGKSTVTFSAKCSPWMSRCQSNKNYHISPRDRKQWDPFQKESTNPVIFAAILGLDLAFK